MSFLSRIPSLFLRQRPLPIAHARRIVPHRLSQHLVIRPASTVQYNTGPSKLYPVRRLATSILRILLYTTVGFGLGLIMATPVSISTATGYLTPKSDEESAQSWTPSDPATQAHEDYLSAHPIIRAMRADPSLTESRPHLRIPPSWRVANLTAGTLMGPNRVPFPPVAWLEADGPTYRYVQVSYVGEELCGHPGIVHGGYLATVLDEGLAHSAFAVLPSHLGVTANLNVDYKAPCKAGQYIVLRAEVTRAEGRKAWVKGRIETLPETEGEQPLVLSEATALYLEPRNPASLTALYDVVSRTA